ncbi:hypothetical protein [Actinophytocola algeriensis]|uniref:Uncharacterized protein n=1 Tax=Actinophytocola algeriensis TaxID=1768010 RepID=A0A7W7Q9H7_9PSEU|nr:hypothetical protein [Actinophytocola algeriensis]MBB4909139.1 hypothetical protein [Actinophytocola algeriensis]MBE1474473.1 hypothetical protein [Actinophytocola algeriensis]
MNTAAIRDMALAHGPFASVYLPSDVGGPGWPVLRRTLAAQDTPEEMLAALDDALSHDGPAEGGRALIVTPSGVLVDGPLTWSPRAPIARLSDLPYLLPLVPRHPVHAPSAALVAAGGADSGPDPADRTMFDQFLFESSRPEGPVVQGVARCAAALRDHNADALVIAEGALADRTVWVGGTHRDQVTDDHADLRAVGMPASCQRADEALPMAALAIGADILVAEDVSLVDGIGVLLSHP